MAIKNKNHSQSVSPAPAHVVAAQSDAKFQKTMNSMLPINTDADSEEKKQSRLWQIIQMILGNKKDVTADIFETQAYDRLLTTNDLTEKDELSSDDIMMSDTSDPKVAEMRVIHLSGPDNQDVYIPERAIEEFRTTHPNLGKDVEYTTIGTAQQKLFDRHLESVSPKTLSAGAGHTILNPELVKRMEKDPKIAHLVDVTLQEATKAGLDGNMLANQFWQESRFNPHAKSGAGAMGIAQIMPFHKGKYGLDSKSDFYDAEKSIRAGAQLMAHLTNEYGDQRLALVAYNGGGKAIDFVEKKLGKAEVSFDEWHGFMSDRREKLGTANRGAWHVETLDYTNKIALAAAPTAPEPA